MTDKLRRRLLLGYQAVVRLSPVVVGATGAYFALLVILPFFLLGIDAVPESELFAERVRYDQTFGVPGDVIGFFLGQYEVLAAVLVPTWILGVVRLKQSRRLHVALALLLGPLPIVYYAVGPYASAMQDWLINY